MIGWINLPTWPVRGGFQSHFTLNRSCMRNWLKWQACGGEEHYSSQPHGKRTLKSWHSRQKYEPLIILLAGRKRRKSVVVFLPSQDLTSQSVTLLTPAPYSMALAVASFRSFQELFYASLLQEQHIKAMLLITCNHMLSDSKLRLPSLIHELYFPL